MGHGQPVFEGTPDELRKNEQIRSEWLEVRGPGHFFSRHSPPPSPCHIAGAETPHGADPDGFGERPSPHCRFPGWKPIRPIPCSSARIHSSSGLVFHGKTVALPLQAKSAPRSSLSPGSEKSNPIIFGWIGQEDADMACPSTRIGGVDISFCWRLTIGPEGVELKFIPVLHGSNGVVLTLPAVISASCVLPNLDLSPAP